MSIIDGLFGPGYGVLGSPAAMSENQLAAYRAQQYADLSPADIGAAGMYEWLRNYRGPEPVVPKGWADWVACGDDLR